MNLSVIVNTCALGPLSGQVKGSNGRSAQHEARIYALRNFILPAYTHNPDIAEVIVVGEWEPGPGYEYYHVPSKLYSCADALEQRQIGFECSDGDYLLFQHDDHFFHGTFVPQLWAYEPFDVISPSRWTRRKTPGGERLNSGEPGGSVWTPPTGLILGHAAFYRREVVEQCPWGNVPKVFTWDIEHTNQIRAAGFTVEWIETVQVWDVETT